MSKAWVDLAAKHHQEAPTPLEMAKFIIDRPHHLGMSSDLVTLAREVVRLSAQLEVCKAQRNQAVRDDIYRWGHMYNHSEKVTEPRIKESIERYDVALTKPEGEET